MSRLNCGFRHAALAVAILLLPPAVASAQDDYNKTYEDCMATARQAPEAGLRKARAWEEKGGGAASRHCAATSLFALQRFPEAALIFENIAATEAPTNPQLASQLYANTGTAWLAARDLDRAYAAQTSGLKLDPGNIELRIDRGLTLAQQNKYWEALDDLNMARDQAPDRADILIFMGTAYRKLCSDVRTDCETFDLARDLLDQALAIEPTNPDGLLERGILKRLAEDIAGARADWTRVVELAPRTPPGEAAQANLRMLEAGQ